ADDAARRATGPGHHRVRGHRGQYRAGGPGAEARPHPLPSGFRGDDPVHRHGRRGRLRRSRRAGHGPDGDGDLGLASAPALGDVLSPGSPIRSVPLSRTSPTDTPRTADVSGPKGGNSSGLRARGMCTISCTTLAEAGELSRLPRVYRLTLRSAYGTPTVW